MPSTSLLFDLSLPPDKQVASYVSIGRSSHWIVRAKVTFADGRVSLNVFNMRTHESRLVRSEEAVPEGFNYAFGLGEFVRVWNNGVGFVGQISERGFLDVFREISCDEIAWQHYVNKIKQSDRMQRLQGEHTVDVYPIPLLPEYCIGDERFLESDLQGYTEIGIMREHPQVRLRRLLGSVEPYLPDNSVPEDEEI